MQRHYFVNKGPLVFPVVVYGCESWTMKKAECQRIDAFELRCWRKLLRVPWTSRRSNQSIVKESVLNIHWKDWCWSWNSNTLATWFEELSHLKRLWCWERLRAGGEGNDRGWDGWMASPTQWTWVWVDSESWWWTGRPGVLWFMGSQRVVHDWVTNWTELNSMMVRWLRVCLPVQGIQIRSLVWEDPTCHEATRPMYQTSEGQALSMHHNEDPAQPK